MSFFQSSNPVLSEKRFQNSVPVSGEVMTVRGAMNKFGFLCIMLMASAFYAWREFELRDNANMMPLILTGAIGGFIIALILMFKNSWAPFLAPVYALLEGLFIGSVSAFYNYAFQDIAPNIITTAVGLTLGVAVAMYFLFSMRIIKVTETFRSVVITATVGLAIFYLIAMVLGFFGINIGFLHEGSMMGIIFSLIVVGLASMNLILDFDRIEQAAQAGAPKYMEWFGAFGLMVTIVWLYLEMLRLLSKLYSRD